MPEIAAGEIPHAAHTDHRIQRRPDAVRPISLPDPARLSFFDDSEPRLPDWERSRVRGMMLVDLGSRQSDFVPLAMQAEKLLRAADDALTNRRQLAEASCA